MSEEWLVKVDGQKSVPYLFKFHHSTMDLSCVTLVTDTKTVWVEVLNSQQFARRWRACNPNSPALHSDSTEEDIWRESALETLSNAHTLGAITDISFEIVESNFSDLAFELESENFKWRWETNSVGYRMSSEIISKQLILPLICVNHIALSSPDAFTAMSDSEVEKAVDKVGRTARRAIDNHVKNALTKPRTSTILRRVTAMFDFVTNLPPIFSTAEKPDLEVKSVEPPPPKASAAVVASTSGGGSSSGPVARQKQKEPSPGPVTIPRSPTIRNSDSSKGKAPAAPPVDDDSATEESDEGDTVPGQVNLEKRDTVMRSPSPPNVPTGAGPSTGSRAPAASARADDSDSDLDAAPKRPVAPKKKRAASTSSDDSSDARPSGPAVKRGARQPVKRGGKRF